MSTEEIKKNKHVDGEHSLEKPACLQYCRMDRRFCPLANVKRDSGNVFAEEFTAQKWTGTETFNSNDKAKLPTADPLTYGLESFADLEGDVEIPNFDEKINREQSHYENKKWRKGWSDYTCWLDGSGFEFDQMPENIIGNSGTMEWMYSLDTYPIEIDSFKLSKWNTWANKFQRDYRFGQLSDLNAETTLFPNVDDPWMFTEYVFQGIESGDVIIEPPLYDEVTMEINNPDKILKEEDLQVIPGFENEHERQEVLAKYGLKTFEADGTKVKSFRQIASWKSQRDNNVEIEVPEQGGKLYRADINVQCVKWGEHGNIPPNTLNMAAPKRWMDVSASAAKIRTKTIAHVGTPYYARSYGVVYWDSGEAWIEEANVIFTPMDLEGPGLLECESAEYQIKTPEGPYGVKQELPMNARPVSRVARNGATRVQTFLHYGELSHRGCQMFKSQNVGGGHGRCFCAAMTTASENGDLTKVKSLRKHFKENCMFANTDCPDWISSPEFPVLADYEGVAFNAAQYREAMFGIYSGEKAYERAWAENMLNGTGQLGDAYGLYSATRLGREDVYNPAEVYVWYEAQFEIVYNTATTPAVEGVTTSGNGFNKGARVVRGSGKTAIDTQEAKDVFKGDTVFFGDLSQTSFTRWLTMPMFCADAAYCGELCGSFMQDGWDPSEKAGDASKGKCKYFKSNTNNKGCPYNLVHKRAYEFQQTMATATVQLFSLGRMWFGKTYKEREEYKYNKARQFYFERYSFDESKTIETYTGIEDGENMSYWNVYLCDETQENAFGGVHLKEEKTFNLTHPKDDIGHVEHETFTGKLLGRLRYGIDVDIEAYFWYQSVDNAGNAQKIWFCKCDVDFYQFTKNVLIVTNEEKFIGGYHPQYKDYSKRGEEYLMDEESDAYRDAMGDIIGDVDHDGQPQAVNKKGYWTDEDGVFIVNEKDIGADMDIMDDDGRENVSSNPVAISFKKSNTEIDGTTGESISPLTLKCSLNANDNYSLIDTYKTGVVDTETGKRHGRPEYEDPKNDKKYWAPPYVKDLYALPTMRMAAHCPECDYYMAYKYHGMRCPWCGSPLETIKGDKGEGLGCGSKWPEDASILRKFFKLNAIGRVQVWAPPGTCIPKDGYYWKNPAVVTDTTLREIKYKMGEFSGRGWKFNSNLKNTTFNLGYPEQLGEYVPLIEDPKAVDKPANKVVLDDVTKQFPKRFASENPVMPDQMMPGFKLPGSDFIEAMMLPYTKNTDDGLKILTAAEMVRMRNHLQPMLAYSSEPPEGRDYPVLRATYDKRTEACAYKYWAKRHCRVPSMILAVNETGNDSWVQFFSGDLLWGVVREYYPGGHSWWWLNQLVGGRYSDLTGGYYHFDGLNGRSGGHWTVSKCVMFLHGILPLDKEILKAYVIFYPAGVPNKEPIGRGWNGVYHYEHFHGFTKKHPNYGDGVGQHLHGQAGTEGFYDEDGEYYGSMHEYAEALKNKDQDVIPMDEGAYYALRGQNGNHHSYIKDDFKESWTGLSGVKDEGFWDQPGTQDISYDNLWRNARCRNMKEEHEDHGYVSLNEDGTVRENYESDEVWGKTKPEDMEAAKEKAVTELTFTVSDGTSEGTESQTFYQYNEEFIDKTYPKYSQEIPDYIDMTGTNSEKRLTYKRIASDAEVQPMADSDEVAEIEAGCVPRIFDVTDIIKKRYNSRVSRSFYCQAGKSFVQLQDGASELFKEPDFDTLDDLSTHEWNTRKIVSGIEDYVLNDETAPYPKLEADNSLPETPTDGSKYPTAEKNLSVTATFSLPFDIDATCCDYEIIINRYDTYVGKIDHGRIADVTEVSRILETMFPGFTITIISETSAKIESSTIEELCIYNSSSANTGKKIYPKLGLICDTYYPRYNRVVEFTSKKEGTVIRSDVPWETENYSYELQSVVYDLCRATPLDNVRDYRYTPASIDCRSCVCPTENCSAHGEVVGVFAKKHKISMSSTQTTCPGSCKCDLTEAPGAVETAGDGIMTYRYRDKLAPNPFVTGIYVDTDSLSYKVSLLDTGSMTWETVLNVVFEPGTSKYRVTVEDDEVLEVDKPEKYYELYKDYTARYAKLTVEQTRLLETLTFSGSSKFVRSTPTWLRVRGAFNYLGMFDWKNCKVELRYANQAVQNMRLAGATASDEYLDLFFFDVMNSDTEDETAEVVIRVSIEVNKYVSTVNAFKVGGFHYAEKDLTRTPPGEEQTFIFTTNSQKYFLKSYPTQITDVFLEKASSGTIKLTPVDKMEDLCFNGVSKRIDGNSIWEIESGTYYFNYRRNAIFLANKVKCGSQELDITAIEKNLTGASYSHSRFPVSVIVRYWTGVGTSVVLEAQAAGMGPSYQVEKGAISKIDTLQLKEFNSFLEDLGEDLPYNGMSEMLPDASGKYARRPIPWVCSNIETATLSEKTQELTMNQFKLPNLPTTALGSNPNDNYFIGLFGRYQEKCIGRCVTKVKFSGPPNKILSGRLQVSAPAVTKKEIETPNGTKVQYERTGGLLNGCVVFSITPNKCEGRKTLAFTKPKLLIYAKDRGLEQDLEN